MRSYLVKSAPNPGTQPPVPLRPTAHNAAGASTRSAASQTLVTNDNGITLRRQTPTQRAVHCEFGGKRARWKQPPWARHCSTRVSKTRASRRLHARWHWHRHCPARTMAWPAPSSCTGLRARCKPRSNTCYQTSRGCVDILTRMRRACRCDVAECVLVYGLCGRHVISLWIRTLRQWPGRPTHRVDSQSWCATAERQWAGACALKETANEVPWYLTTLVQSHQCRCLSLWRRSTRAPTRRLSPTSGRRWRGASHPLRALSHGHIVGARGQACS